MALYGIADLHLSFSTDKPMDIYGPAWENHTEVLKREWTELVKEEDTVIIAGDISWGLKLSEAMADLEWIDKLPGKKVLFKGNHDPWWSSVSKLNKISERMFFVQNTFYVYEDFAICLTIVFIF
ncbi:MAG: metallophosphoesterase [Firmicutes bacterium]|nr:metallophosphoesterase [Bacillota bacterium]